eukprot:3940303-Rhodomonas_salina.5
MAWWRRRLRKRRNGNTGVQPCAPSVLHRRNTCVDIRRERTAQRNTGVQPYARSVPHRANTSVLCPHWKRLRATLVCYVA